MGGIGRRKSRGVEAEVRKRDGVGGMGMGREGGEGGRAQAGDEFRQGQVIFQVGENGSSR